LSVASEIDLLRQKLRDANQAYYLEDTPSISDSEYDSLMRELQALEKENPQLVTADSPSARVGIEPGTDFSPIEHRTPMLSLDNSLGLSEFFEFHERTVKVLGFEPEYFVEFKLDGLGIERYVQVFIPKLE